MLPRIHARVRRVRKHYLPMLDKLRELVELDLPQKEICNILNQMGFTNSKKQPLQQGNLSHLIKNFRASGDIPPGPQQ